MTDKYIKRTEGFTLVELSIVIIIIGFLIAGISAGTSLIKQVQIHSVISDFTNFRMALDTFKSKYDSLPGDISNAYAYFGAVCGENTIGAATSCNGNGNGLINFPGAGGSTTPFEDLKFWQHLSLAGLIQGNFTGVPSNVRQEAGINVPTSKIVNSGYRVGTADGIIYGVDLTLVNYMQLGKYLVGTQGVYGESIFTPAEAYLIDNKLDDGNPSRGKIIVHRGNEVSGNNVCMTGFVFTGQEESFLFNDPTTSCVVDYLFEQNGNF